MDATEVEPGGPDGAAVEVAFRTGIGSTFEYETGAALRTTGGLSASYRLPAELRVVGAVSLGAHQQRWLSVNSAPEGGLQPLEATELGWDARLGATWDAAPHLPGLKSVESRLRLDLGLAAHLLALENPYVPTVSVGPRLSAGLRIWPADGLRLQGQFGVTPIFGGTPDTLSALGTPEAGWDAELGVALEHGESRTWAVELDYTPYAIVFEHTVRRSHGAVAGLSFAL